MELLKDLKLQKYRERWRSILCTINPDSQWFEIKDPVMKELGVQEGPTPELIYALKMFFLRCVRVFAQIKDQMPKSVVRSAGGRTSYKERHNHMSYNFNIRKGLEYLGTRYYHADFPLPCSEKKVRALDDIWRKMCPLLNIPFVPTVIVKRSKIKRVTS
jgi:hypothetical protein